MAFIARESKPCTWCKVMIEKGTDAGFTWDRTNSGYIHFSCMKERKAATVTTPVTVPATVETNGHGKDIRADKPRLNEDAASDLARIIQTIAGARGIDEKEVRRIAADEASKVSVTPRCVEFKVNDAPSIKLDLAHHEIETLVKLLSVKTLNGHRFNVYMHGPAGSGKSTAAHQVATVLGLKYAYQSLNPQTPDSRLLGYMHAGGQYVESEFFRLYTQGGVFCLDEIDNASGSLVVTLNSLLENGLGAFPHGMFERHKDFVCVCTANTIGRGGNIHYPERRALDAAFLERFVFLDWAWDKFLTESIITGILGTADGKTLIAWVEEEAREIQAHFPALLVTPRAYIQAALLQREGFTKSQIRDMAIARGVK